MRDTRLRYTPMLQLTYELRGPLDRMAMAHSRKITVDGTTYEWKVRGGRYTSESSPHIKLTVRSPASAFLQVDLQAKRLRDDYGDGDVACMDEARLPPSDVASVIRWATSLGWDPTKKTGRPFVPQGQVDLIDYKSA